MAGPPMMSSGFGAELLEAQRADRSSHERRDGEQHEGGQRAADEGEAELYGHCAGRLFGGPPSFSAGLMGEEFERRPERAAVALGAADRGGEGSSGLAESFRQRLECVGQAL